MSQVCPSCRAQNDDISARFCDQCGATLSNVEKLDSAVSPTDPPQLSEKPTLVNASTPQPDCSNAPIPQSTDSQSQQSIPTSVPAVPVYRLVVNGHDIPVPPKADVVVGRPGTGWNPDVDLLPFGGISEVGVSRKHLRIFWQDGWMIEDLKSTNGTWIGELKLEPSKPMPINSGDVLQLGNFQITFLVEQGTNSQ